MRRSLPTLALAMPPCGFTPPPYTGPSRKALAAQRKKYMHPIHNTYYAKPLIAAAGHMQYIYDEKGNRYLDLFGGVTTVSVGHSHPRITKVLEAQNKLINHTTVLYLNPKIGEFSQEFASKLPKSEDWVVNVVNSGSEANDFALLMARNYTKNYQYMSCRGGYHGFTEGSRGLITAAGWKHKVPPPPGMLRTIAAHPYRGILGTEPADVDKYITEADEMIRVETGGAVAGLVAERIQGVGGCVPQIKGYLPKMAELVRSYGGLYVSDEVQCGYGRLGSHYWGFEEEGIVPDIITTAKSVANGWSVGVVACRRPIAEAMKGTAYFNTFGGNALCSAVGTETLRIIEDEKMQQNCSVIGAVLEAGFKKLAKKHAVIGDVRVTGLMSGVEFVSDRKTKKPDAAALTFIHEALYNDYNILVGKGGAANVMRLHPPMCMTVADAKYFLAAMAAILSTL
jgi:alanine-glyoxylate transaminase/(R)-3-amino-2-methylpropionate-pyruvate transaminase